MQVATPPDYLFPVSDEPLIDARSDTLHELSFPETSESKIYGTQPTP